jgi:MFS family permease
VGGSSGLVTPIVSASLQEMTPKELMARVFGVFNTGTMVSAMIGMTLFGWAADRFNPAASVLAIGGIILGTAAITVLMIPAYLRLTKMTAVAT